MNGQPTTHYSTNSITNHSDQSIGKFHVINVDKSTASGHDETALTCPISQPPSADEATSCPSRFQMIRVDRNFGRGRWKVNDYEPPENASSTVPVNASENDPATMANTGILNAPLPNATTSTTIPANVLPVPGVDSNGTSSAALAATAASAAAAAVTAFQQQQHRLALGNSATVLPPPNVPPQSGLLHAYPNAALANLAASNQSFLLSNHPQFGYYPFYPPPYASFAAQWAALAAANPFLGPPGLAPHQQPSSQLPTGNLGDPNRHTDTDVNGEPTVISSMPFPNLTAEHLQNAQLAAAAAPYFYAAHHPHASFVPQQSATTASYQNLTGYPGVPPPNTTIPQQHQLPPQSLPLAQYNIDVQQQQAPVLTSPKHDTSYNKNVPPPSTNVPSTTKMTTQANAFKTMATTNGTNNDLSQQMKTNPNTSTPFTDLLSSSPTISHPKSSLLSPISVTTSTNSNNNNPMGTTSLNDIWTLTTGGSPLNSAQTAAVAAMGLLNNENSKNTEIANKILEELTTPTKQNNTTDIDNKISAAMDLVKMHLLSAVREEVTELRQQIRTLNEKMSSVEQENVFLRLHVPSEVYAQYTASLSGSSSSDVNTNTAIPSLPSSSIVSSQSIQMPPLSSTASQLPHPSSVAQPPPSSNTITSQSQQQPLPPSSTNLPPPP